MNYAASYVHSDEDVEHHGVIGMHWGVRKARRYERKGDSQRAKEQYKKTYSKASATLRKDENKITKRMNKATKLSSKILATNDFQTSQKRYDKLTKKKDKISKQINSYERLAKAVSKSYQNVPLSYLDSTDIQYVKTSLDKSETFNTYLGTIGLESQFRYLMKDTLGGV